MRINKYFLGTVSVLSNVPSAAATVFSRILHDLVQDLTSLSPPVTYWVSASWVCLCPLPWCLCSVPRTVGKMSLLISVSCSWYLITWAVPLWLSQVSSMCLSLLFFSLHSPILLLSLLYQLAYCDSIPIASPLRGRMRGTGRKRETRIRGTVRSWIGITGWPFDWVLKQSTDKLCR